MHDTTRRAPLRRVLATALAGVTAVALLPTAASAQTEVPPPTPIDGFCAVVPAEDDFTDVDDSDPWVEAVRCLSHAGITQGVTDTEYDPDVAVTRAQMASFVARMLDVAAIQAVDDGDLNALPDYDGSNAFTDVSDTSTHVDDINRLAEAGIALGGPYGLPDSSYGPDLNVRRDQMASFITRGLEYLTGVERTASADYFIDDESSVHEPNINALAAVGIVGGYGDNVYRPSWAVLRGTMARFLIRPLANLEQARVIRALPRPTDMPVVVTDEFSAATSTDNGNGTATISLVVRDREDNGVEWLDAADVSLVVPGQTDPTSLADLLADFPETWSEFTDTAAGEGVYTILFTPDRNGTFTYEDIAVLDTVIESSLDVVVTGS